MHLPDGFLDARTAILTGALATAGVGISLLKVKTSKNPRIVPMMGLSAAFLFVAQMINFPIAGGTSGHLVGSALAAVLLGPAPAVLVLSSVLVIQCLLFADGGISALGANIFNMAIAATLAGYFFCRPVLRLFPGERGQVAATAFAGWSSIVLASVFCAGELAWSGTVPWRLVFPAMANIHMLIGIGEGLISALIVTTLSRTRPELLRIQETAGSNLGFSHGFGYAAVIVIGAMLFVAPFASAWPDGLEAVAASLGFENRATSNSVLHAPMAEYSIPRVVFTPAGTILSGMAGTIAVFVLAYLLSRILVPRAKSH